MASTGARRRGQKVRRRARSILDLWVECFSAHNILTYASAIGLCVLGALLVLSSASKLAANNGFLHALLGLGRWALALALLGVAVGLLVHFAPVRRRAERWVGLGTVLVVVTWAVTALIFRWF